MGDLEPITRNEKLWSGEDLTPVTRREMYIKHLYDETQVIPEYPVTREEMFILKAGEELHDVTIEQLTATENKTYSEKGIAYSPVIVNVPQTTLTTLDVTENGTYTAPSGTAYSEVDVDVPLPENAYLLKEIEDVEIASFNDGSDLSMPKLEVAIEPQQDLHGYDAPWVGGAGKNKLDQDTTYASYKQSDGSFRLTANNAVGIKNYIPQDLINKQLTFSVYVDLSKETSPNYIRTIAEVGGMLVSGTDVSSGNKGYISVTFTPTSTDDFFYFTYGSGGNNYFTMKDLMLEVSSARTTFVPYSNICPISGWDEVNVGVADDVETPTVSNVYTLDLDGTRYGGKVDLVSGVLTVDRVGIKGVSVVRVGQTGSGVRYADTTHIYADLVQNTTTISDRYVQINTSQSGENGKFRAYSGEFTIYDDRFTDTTTAQSLLNDVEFVYELATPLTIQLTPTVVKSLRGKNNVFADTGNILDLSYLAKEE